MSSLLCKHYGQKTVVLIRGLFERTLKSNDNFLTNKRYDEYFGFKEDEVRELLSTYTRVFLPII